MKTINFTDFRKRASGLLTEVENGETLVVLRHGRAIAEIIPARRNETKVPSWKRPALKLSISGASLTKAILEEREAE